MNRSRASGATRSLACRALTGVNPSGRRRTAAARAWISVSAVVRIRNTAGPRLEVDPERITLSGGAFEARNTAKGDGPRAESARSREKSTRRQIRPIETVKSLDRLTLEGAWVEGESSQKSGKILPQVVVSARSSGLRAIGASSLPTRGSGQWREFEEAPFPITAAGPRRFRTGFPSTETFSNQQTS
jgi:hypothetical protein